MGLRWTHAGVQRRPRTRGRGCRGTLPSATRDAAAPSSCPKRGEPAPRSGCRGRRGRRLFVPFGFAHSVQLRRGHPRKRSFPTNRGAQRRGSLAGRPRPRRPPPPASWSPAVQEGGLSHEAGGHGSCADVHSPGQSHLCFRSCLTGARAQRLQLTGRGAQGSRLLPREAPPAPWASQREACGEASQLLPEPSHLALGGI